MTLCNMKNNKGGPCSNKAADGFTIDGVAVCKTHYGNHAIAQRQAEIDAAAPPKEPVPIVELTPCKCKTKEGTKDEKPCQNKAKTDGMCPAHYNAHMKKLAKESAPPEEEVERVPCKQIIKDPKEGSKQCTQLEVNGCDGYCKRHYNLKLKAEQKDTKTVDITALAQAAEAAVAALNAAKEAASKEDIDIPKTKSKKERKPRVPKKETLENIVEKLEEENSDLLSKIPPMDGVNINNPMEDIEIPEVY
jgi:hypothetical protein